MAKMTNILITSSGRRGYLAQYFKQAVGDAGNIYATDIDSLAPIFGECDQGFIVPPFDANNYLSVIKSICIEYDIDLLVPTNDRELNLLAENVPLFNEIGTTTLISSLRCIEIANDKMKTFDFLQSKNIKTAFTTNNLTELVGKIDSKEISFPIIIKPQYGSGSQGVYEATNFDEINVFWNRLENPIGQEKLQGQEFGIDVFNNSERTPVSIVPRKKIAMRAGETDKAESVNDQQLIDIGTELAEALGHFGPLDIDCFYDGDEVYIMELNARFGGGYPLTHLAGGDFTTAAISLANNEKISPRIGKFESGVQMVKSYKIYNPQAGPHNPIITQQTEEL